MNIRLLPGVVRKDSLKEGNDEGAVLEFKRFKSKAEAQAQKDSPWLTFDVQLDLRARLFWIGRGHDAQTSMSPHDVGQAILREAGRFLMVPLSDLVAPLQPSAVRRAEWVVRDADHLLGLLHRVQEAQVFRAADRTPRAAQLPPLLKRLAASIGRNAKGYAERHQQIAYTSGWNKPIEPPDVDLSVWQAHGTRILELLDDAETKEDLLRWHEMLSQRLDALETLRHMYDPDARSVLFHKGPEWAARNRLLHNEMEFQQLGAKVVQRIAEPAEGA